MNKLLEVILTVVEELVSVQVDQAVVQQLKILTGQTY